MEVPAVNGQTPDLDRGMSTINQLFGDSFGEDRDMLVKVDQKLFPACQHDYSHYNQTSLSGSALVSINEVTLRRARLVLGWVTVFGRVRHLNV